MFRTDFDIPYSGLSLTHHHNFLSLGSCFAEVTGQFLKKNKFKTLTNPFGILFNPLSIFNLIDLDFILKDHHFIERDGIWLNYQLHSDIYASTKQKLYDEIKIRYDLYSNFLKKTNILIITFGTSFIYKLKSHNIPVANCHKSNSNLFTKEFLSPEAITTQFSKFYNSILSINPEIKVILTVSPVRHVKDTLPLNNLSKSILSVACHTIVNTYKGISYFPSFELMMDDLRDYRFYKEDMIHPTTQAEAYIMQKFMSTYFAQETIKILEKVKLINNDLEHRPFHPHSASYKEFLNKTIQKIKGLSAELDFTKELAYLEQTINSLKI